MALWGGRFSQDAKSSVQEYTESIPFDKLLFRHDITESKAHATMLGTTGIRNLQFLPDRKKFPGKLVLKAFQERNRQIVDSCDILLAVWDGKSRGTKNTLAYARRINKPAFLVRFRQGNEKPS